MLGALLFIAVGLGLYAAAPWILPVRIVEGPLVQQAGAGTAIVVWYTSRPARCELSYAPDANERFAEITADDRRHSALLTDLQPGREHAYRITVGERMLAQAALKPVRPPPSRSTSSFSVTAAWHRKPSISSQHR